VKRRFGLGLVMALCLCVASGAWAARIAAPQLPSDFDPGSAKVSTDVALGYVSGDQNYRVILFSVDQTGKQLMAFSGDRDGTRRDFVFVSHDKGSSVASPDLDFVLIRAGENAKSQVFSADYGGAVPAGATDPNGEAVWIMGFNNKDWRLYSEDSVPYGTLSQVVSYDSSDKYGHREFYVWWNCPACGANPCDTLQLATLSFDRVSFDISSKDAESIDFAVYIPCGTYEKRWQVMPKNLNCLVSGDPKVVETPVHYLDMVLYGTSVSGSHTLDLGPYVIDGTLHTERFNTTHKLWGPTAATDITGIDESNRLKAQGDWVAERILNKGPYLAKALGDSRFMWSAVKETSADASGYKYRILS